MTPDAQSNAAANPSAPVTGETPRLSGATSAFGLQTIWAEGQRLGKISRQQMFQQLVRHSWRSFIASPLTAFLTLLTVTVVLFIFGAFLLLMQNVSGFLAMTQSNLTMRLYVRDMATDSQREELRGAIQSAAGVEIVRFITKAEALEEFKRGLGTIESLVEGLKDENPLPASFEVRFQAGEGLERSMRDFADKFKDHAAVEHLQYSQSLLGEMSGLVRVFRLSGIFAVLFMLIVTCFVISITIRLALYAHRTEIQIMRLVGATDTFIRAPFLIEGVVEGFVGSVMSLMLLSFAFSLVQSAFVGTEVVAWLGHSLKFLSVWWIFLVIILGPLVGLMGSFLAVRRFSEE